MRASALLNRQASRESTQRARELFEAALRLSPGHVPALNGLAQAMLVQWQSTWYPRSSEEHLEELDRVVNKALEVKPDDALATYLRGYVLKRLRKDLDQALTAFERAIALDPNLAVAHNYVGQIKVFLGRANEAAEHTLRAIELSPRDPQLALWYYQLALTYIHEQRYDEAVNGGVAAWRSIQTCAILIAYLRQRLRCRGRVDEARTIAAEMLRRYPKETIRTFLTREPWPNSVYRAGQEREIMGMRLAGIPECMATGAVKPNCRPYAQAAELPYAPSHAPPFYSPANRRLILLRPGLRCAIPDICDTAGRNGLLRSGMDQA